jgi:hypothetical protein
VAWVSRQQSVVAFSTAEAEYIALSEGAREATWLRRVGHDLGVTSPWPIPIHLDNQAALSLGGSGADSSRTKHIDVHCHFVRQQVAREVLRLVYIPTAENPADLLTKPLPKPRFKMLRGLLGIA